MFQIKNRIKSVIFVFLMPMIWGGSEVLPNLSELPGTHQKERESFCTEVTEKLFFTYRILTPLLISASTCNPAIVLMNKMIEKFEKKAQNWTDYAKFVVLFSASQILIEGISSYFVINPVALTMSIAWVVTLINRVLSKKDWALDRKLLRTIGLIGLELIISILCVKQIIILQCISAGLLFIPITKLIVFWCKNKTYNKKQDFRQILSTSLVIMATFMPYVLRLLPIQLINALSFHLSFFGITIYPIASCVLSIGLIFWIIVTEKLPGHFDFWIILWGISICLSLCPLAGAIHNPGMIIYNSDLFATGARPLNIFGFVINIFKLFVMKIIFVLISAYFSLNLTTAAVGMSIFLYFISSILKYRDPSRNYSFSELLGNIIGLIIIGLCINNMMLLFWIVCGFNCVALALMYFFPGYFNKAFVMSIINNWILLTIQIPLADYIPYVYSYFGDLFENLLKVFDLQKQNIAINFYGTKVQPFMYLVSSIGLVLWAFLIINLFN